MRLAVAETFGDACQLGRENSAEREAFIQLWADVATLMKKMEEKPR